jgi:hypothetical protein
MDLVQRRWFWRLIWVAIIVAGLVIKSLQSPLYLFGAAFDDQLMVSMAQGFLHGHWSTAWSATGLATLSKPVGYPIFLSVVHFFPWSPVLSNYMFYIVGGFLIAWSWRRISGSRPQATVLLAVLVFNPILFISQNQRIYRDSFICTISTLAIGLAFVIAAGLESTRLGTDRAGSVALSSHGAHRRRKAFSELLRRSRIFVLAALMGLTIGVAAVTKPTWVWLVPAVGAPLAYPLVQRLRPRGHRVATALRAGLAGLLVLVCGLGVVEATKLMNERTYHVALVEDLSSGSLARTWKVWASVEAGPPRKFVPITEAMRIAVYRVSPAAAELKATLESKSDGWKAVDCESPLKICDESGNWFEWDMQSAAVATGRIHSVRQLQMFFNTVANEISSACDTGTLRCTSSPVLAIGLPPLNQIPITTVLSDTADGIWQMLWSRLPMGRQQGPPPTPETYQLWQSVIPGMSSYSSVASATSPSQLYFVLSLIDALYWVFNLLLLVVLSLGVMLWGLLRLSRRSRRKSPSLYPTFAAGLFLLSALIGIGTLAVFAVGQDPYYIKVSLYWTDFASPAQLSLVFGAFAAWSVIKQGRPVPRTEIEPVSELVMQAKLPVP